MHRVKISEPESYLFKTLIRIRASDLNYGNHLSNDAFLKFAQEARMQFFNHFGYSELEMEGIATIMADSEIKFMAQGYYNDEIRMELGISDYSKVGFNLVYKFYNTKSDKTMALIKTGILGFDYSENKVQEIPKTVWDKFGLQYP